VSGGPNSPEKTRSNRNMHLAEGKRGRGLLGTSKRGKKRGASSKRMSRGARLNLVERGERRIPALNAREKKYVDWAREKKVPVVRLMKGENVEKKTQKCGIPK